MSPLGRLPSAVTVYEVGPRDGLQNEATQVPLAAKLAFIHALAEAGLRRVETTSFVRPSWVPQLADADALMAALERRPGVRYPVLVPNERGLDRALAAGADAIAIFLGATESFSHRNLNAGIEAAFARVRPVVERARDAGVWVRGYLSVVWGCPYEGAVAPATVARLAEAMMAMGVEELSLGDTIGVATPGGVSDVVEAVGEKIPLERLALHFHDTRGTALANVLAGLLLGVSTFDASAGGLGGCPYAPGAAGNLATEDLLYMLEGLGVPTGVDIEKVRAASLAIARILGRPVPGRYALAGPFLPSGDAACGRG